MRKHSKNTTRKGGATRTPTRKAQKRRSKMKVKQTKVSVIKHPNRRQKTALSSVEKCPEQTTSTSTHKPGSQSVSVITAKHDKTHSLSYHRGWFESNPTYKSMVVLEDGRKVIAGGTWSVMLFPKKMGQYTAGYYCREPLAITSCKNKPDECIVIGKTGPSHEDLYKFHIVEINENNFVKIEHKIETVTEYFIIAITTCNDNIYALCGTDPPSLKMFVSDRPGPVWSRETGEDGNALFRKPTCITSFFTTKGVRLVVANSCDDKLMNLMLLDGARGNMLKSQKALLRSVVGLTTDKYENVFVCYKSPCAISVLQNDLSNERFVYQSKNLLTSPSCLAYDKTSEQLLLLDDGHTLHTFKLSYT